MAYNEYFVENIRRVMLDKAVHYEEKRMFGGICFMVDEKMCLGLHTDKQSGEERFMLRLDPDKYEEMLSREGARQMDFTGKPLKGFVYVDPEVLEDEEKLSEWIQLALDYNPKAKQAKKKTK